MKITRQTIVIFVAMIAVLALAGYAWLQSKQIRHSQLSVHCVRLDCRYSLTLNNPGPLQGVQLMWIAHTVNQDRSDIFSWITKHTQEVTGQKIFMVAGSQRRVSGRIRKPPDTSYVVLKLKPIVP